LQVRFLSVLSLSWQITVPSLSWQTTQWNHDRFRFKKGRKLFGGWRVSFCRSPPTTGFVDTHGGTAQQRADGVGQGLAALDGRTGTANNASFCDAIL
jgi:hypothetical protein